MFLERNYYFISCMFKIILVGILTIVLFSLAGASGQLEVPTKFSTFTNKEYWIQLECPSE